MSHERRLNDQRLTSTPARTTEIRATMLNRRGVPNSDQIADAATPLKTAIRAVFDDLARRHLYPQIASTQRVRIRVANGGNTLFRFFDS
jgi:hypothetical protein